MALRDMELRMKTEDRGEGPVGHGEYDPQAEA